MMRLGAGCTELYIQIELIISLNYTLGPKNVKRINDTLLQFCVDVPPDQLCDANVSLLDNDTTVEMTIHSKTSVDCGQLNGNECKNSCEGLA